MKVFKITILSLLSTSVVAGELSYFDSKIDYWGDGKEISVTPIIEKSNQKNDEKFPWKTYLDPKNKEFFKEGDYTPPEPFMEVARNPTDENIKQWFELMKKKNELQTKLQVRMQEYLARNSSVKVISETSQTQQASVSQLVKEAKNQLLEPSQFKIRMYFESTCPHCRRMFGVLRSLQDEGFKVEALQIDRGPVPEEEKVIPIGLAEKSEVKKHGINGVPFLLIADLKRKALMPPIQGYHDLKELKLLMKEASR